MTSESNPVVAQIRDEIAKICGKSPSETPIFDALAEEYDLEYRNIQFFDSALSERLNGWKKGRKSR